MIRGPRREYVIALRCLGYTRHRDMDWWTHPFLPSVSYFDLLTHWI